MKFWLFSPLKVALKFFSWVLLLFDAPDMDWFSTTLEETVERYFCVADIPNQGPSSPSLIPEEPSVCSTPSAEFHAQEKMASTETGVVELVSTPVDASLDPQKGMLWPGIAKSPMELITYLWCVCMMWEKYHKYTSPCYHFNLYIFVIFFFFVCGHFYRVFGLSVLVSCGGGW